MELATKELRLINAIIDTITYIVFWFILSILLMLLGIDQTIVDDTGEELPLIPLIIAIPAFWGYYLISESCWQKTLGKLITQTKVVTKTGEKPSFKQILIRTLCRSIPFEYFSYLVSVEGIHDTLSSTRVIRKTATVIGYPPTATTT